MKTLHFSDAYGRTAINAINDILGVTVSQKSSFTLPPIIAEEFAAALLSAVGIAREWADDTGKVASDVLGTSD